MAFAIVLAVLAIVFVFFLRRRVRQHTRTLADLQVWKQQTTDEVLKLRALVTQQAARIGELEEHGNIAAGKGQAATQPQQPAPATAPPQPDRASVAQAPQVAPLRTPEAAIPTAPVLPPTPPVYPPAPSVLPAYTSPSAAPAESTGPILPPKPPVPPARRLSLEERLGHNWLNKVGVVTLVIGIALFLGYQLRTLGPAGKSTMGFLLSALLLGGGIWLERKPQYRVFARAGIGGGWSLLFFVTFAIYHLDATRILHSQGVDLVLMMLVATGMVVHSLRYKSQVVTGLAFLLAYVTVGISHVTIFSLVAGALLAAGLAWVVAREFWFELGLLGMAGAYINHFVWLERVLPGGAVIGKPFPQFFASAALLLLYWLIFRLLYVLRVPKSRYQEAVSSFAAILNTAGLLALLKYQSSHPEWAFYGLVALGIAEMVLAFVGRARWRQSFLVLSTVASVCLLAAVPFRFHGGTWTMLWLLEAEMLVIAGLRMREVAFRRLGLLAALLAGFKVLASDTGRIADLRTFAPDPSHHPLVATALLLAAAVLWLNGEFAPRRWAEQFAETFETVAATVSSYVALITLAAGLWVCLPMGWSAVSWLAAVLAIGFVADRLESRQLATEADLLAVAGVLRLLLINFGLTTALGPPHLRAVTVTIAAALLYAGMRRRTPFLLSARNYIAASYSWVAAVLLASLLWYELRAVSVAVAWAAFGLVLFEIGAAAPRNFLRRQGYALIAASFVRMFFANLNVGAATHAASPRVYTVLPLIAAFVWIYERARPFGEQDRIDRIAGPAAAWMGTIAATALLYFEVRPELVLVAWAALALLLLLLAWALRRSLLTVQAVVMLLVTGGRAAGYNLLAPTPLAGSLFTSRTGTVTAACVLMLAALPIGFALRRRVVAESGATKWWQKLFARPEQVFFFVPLVLATVLLAVVLRAGMITVGWITLGLVTFLFALAVKERSFRLSGLALLLLGLGKIIVIDVWHASPTDRYLTLIVTGAALLLVSFLYSRYRETILKLL